MMSHDNGEPIPGSSDPVDASTDSTLSRRDILKRLAQVGLVAPFATASVAAAMQTPGAPANVRILNSAEGMGGKPVLKPEDLKFKGFIRFPQAGVGGLWYASKTIAVRKVGADTRVFIIGDVTDSNPLYELSMPDNPNPTLSSAPLCTFVQNWGTVMAGRMLTGGSAGLTAEVPASSAASVPGTTRPTLCGGRTATTTCRLSRIRR